MDHFFTRNSMGRVFGFLEVSSVRKKWKIYPNFKIPEIFGFLDLGLSLEPDTWLYLFGHGISQTQPMWGHTQNFSSFGPLILHLQMWSWDPLTSRVKYNFDDLVNYEPILHPCMDLNLTCLFRELYTKFIELRLCKKFYNKKCKLSKKII